MGLAISQLYKNLDALGFRSGGEFVAAMEEVRLMHRCAGEGRGVGWWLAAMEEASQLRNGAGDEVA